MKKNKKKFSRSSEKALLRKQTISDQQYQEGFTEIKDLPERINLIRDDMTASGLFCLGRYKTALVNIASKLDTTTVSYIREDTIPSDEEREKKIARQKEDISFLKDSISSLRAARQAILLTRLTYLKRLVLRFYVCYILFGLSMGMTVIFYPAICEHWYWQLLGIAVSFLITLYIVNYSSRQVKELEEEAFRTIVIK